MTSNCKFARGGGLFKDRRMMFLAKVIVSWETSSISHFGGSVGWLDGWMRVSYYATLAATTHTLQQQQQHIEG